MEQPLLAFEHTDLPIGDEGTALTPAEVDRILALRSRHPGFCSVGFRSIRFRQYAGLLNLGSRTLEILPKIDSEVPDAARSRSTLLWLLHHAGHVSLSSLGQVGQSIHRHALADIFVQAFLSELVELHRRGLLSRYVSRQEDCVSVRGRIAMARQISTNALRPDRIACQYDDFAVNNFLNHWLVAALDAIRSRTESGPLARRWVELRHCFSEVSSHPQSALREPATLHRGSSYYTAALQWATWILRVLSPTLRAGAADAPSVLFDVNKLFESAVARWTEEQALERKLYCETQCVGKNLAVGVESTATVSLRPDMVIRSEDRVIGIADAKWKRLELDALARPVPARSDVMQMLAYAAAYECSTVALVYPWHAGLPTSAPCSFRLPDGVTGAITLHLVCLDVERWKPAVRFGAWPW